MAGEARRGIKSVEVAGDILNRLAHSQAPVSLRDMAAAGRMSPGKVHRDLASFLACGLARRDPDTRRYSLGPLAFRVGLAALNSHQPLRDAIALQIELRDRLDETMVLSVWGTHGPTIVHVAESSQPIIMTMRVGAVLPILATASGLAFASFLPRKFTIPHIKAALKSRDGLNLFVPDTTSLDRLIEKVRKQGFAFNEGHLIPGVSAVAFPLFDRTSTLVAVLAVMGRHEQVNPSDAKEMIAHLKKSAAGFGR